MKLENYLNDIFTISRRKPAPKLRRYRATWPCGSTWEFNRHDLEIPEYRNGEQYGITWCFTTVRDAREMLESLGCKVEVLA
jgi:hypothetical protein